MLLVAIGYMSLAWSWIQCPVVIKCRVVHAEWQSVSCAYLHQEYKPMRCCPMFCVCKGESCVLLSLQITSQCTKLSIYHCTFSFSTRVIFACVWYMTRIHEGPLTMSYFPQVAALPLYFWMSALAFPLHWSNLILFEDKEAYTFIQFHWVGFTQYTLEDFCILHPAKICANAVIYFVTLSFPFPNESEIVFFQYYH